MALQKTLGDLDGAGILMTKSFIQTSYASQGPSDPQTLGGWWFPSNSGKGRTSPVHL